MLEIRLQFSDVLSLLCTTFLVHYEIVGTRQFYERNGVYGKVFPSKVERLHTLAKGAITHCIMERIFSVHGLMWPLHLYTEFSIFTDKLRPHDDVVESNLCSVPEVNVHTMGQGDVSTHFIVVDN